MVTIVTEAALERVLIAELEQLGARGFTITDARGKGSRGTRQSDWAQAGNIRVEVICEPALAERIAEGIERYRRQVELGLASRDGLPGGVR